MELSEDQINQYENEGYIIIPNLFSPEEISIPKKEVPQIFSQQRDENVREKDGETVRTSFATHTYNDLFAQFVRHPCVLKAAEQLLEGKVYVHQFKLNAKAAFTGDVWQWHQDFGTWHRDDGMPEDLVY